ncbi:predicted protein [Sclerotinia sclerotiorum 1980 UF-70]|uniref:Uncharacterized protein n=1 Tax=Sclerotinia sclerotiorum (strain ATCC 18683 / 1980 / Ss-1) TaxID=665079 RepID=A7EPM5_SCLS1|nr:predicted protein [Sclerotinia sclerotiorum 1980 UF-70]EDO04791.1 predicted protein [Sclerotinia sclerotiorum 1980 UF-70]
MLRFTDHSLIVGSLTVNRSLSLHLKRTKYYGKGFEVIVKTRSGPFFPGFPTVIHDYLVSITFTRKASDTGQMSYFRSDYGYETSTTWLLLSKMEGLHKVLVRVDVVFSLCYSSIQLVLGIWEIRMPSNPTILPFVTRRSKLWD